MTLLVLQTKLCVLRGLPPTIDFTIYIKHLQVLDSADGSVSLNCALLLSVSRKASAAAPHVKLEVWNSPVGSTAQTFTQFPCFSKCFNGLTCNHFQSRSIKVPDLQAPGLERKVPPSSLPASLAAWHWAVLGPALPKCPLFELFVEVNRGAAPPIFEGMKKGYVLALKGYKLFVWHAKTRRWMCKQPCHRRVQILFKTPDTGQHQNHKFSTLESLHYKGS